MLLALKNQEQRVMLILSDEVLATVGEACHIIGSGLLRNLEALGDIRSITLSDVCTSVAGLRLVEPVHDLMTTKSILYHFTSLDKAWIATMVLGGACGAYVAGTIESVPERARDLAKTQWPSLRKGLRRIWE